MSKLVKFFAIAVLIAGAFAVTPGPALAQHQWRRRLAWRWRTGTAVAALARRRLAGWRLGTRTVLGLGLGSILLRRSLLRGAGLRLGARARLAPRPLGAAPRLALLVMCSP